MQIQNAGIVIVAIILALGFAYALYIAVTYFVTSDKAKHYCAGRTAALQQARLEKDRLTTADLQTLLDITNTLRLAHSTWLPMPGTEPVRARVVIQLTALNKIASRMGNEPSAYQAMPTDAAPRPAEGEAA